MRCKIFNFPIEPERAVDRERDLNDFLGATSVKRVFASLANQPEGPSWSVLFFYEDVAQATQKASTRPDATVVPGPTIAGTQVGTPLTGEQVKSIIALKKWRADQAAAEGVPLYMVAQNKWLEEIVQMPGRTLDDLKRVNGLGEWRVQKYGNKILEVLSATSQRSGSESSYRAGHA